MQKLFRRLAPALSVAVAVAAPARASAGACPPPDEYCAGDDDCDGVENDRDSCRTCANPNQADRDGDGVGDACDLCPGAFNPIAEEGVKRQADWDGDGVGDACDNCPQVHNPEQDRASCDAERRVYWRKFSRDIGRSHGFFARPVLSAFHAEDAWRSGAGVHAFYGLSLDRWRYVEDGNALPPTLFLRSGATFTGSLFDALHAGAFTSLDWRPMHWSWYARSCLVGPLCTRHLFPGLYAHGIYSYDDTESVEYEAVNLGAGGKLSFLDIFYLAVYVQWDAAGDWDRSYGLTLAFDLDIFEDLGARQLKGQLRSRYGAGSPSD